MGVESRFGSGFAHAIVDDHSRLAYVEHYDDYRAATVTAFVERALVFFAGHGIVCKCLMTDNGFSYMKNRSLAEHDHTAHSETGPPISRVHNVRG